MKVKIIYANKTESQLLDYNHSDTIKDLKLKLNLSNNIKLIHAGKLLNDNQLLSNTLSYDNNCIHIVLQRKDSVLEPTKTNTNTNTSTSSSSNTTEKLNIVNDIDNAIPFLLQNIPTYSHNHFQSQNIYLNGNWYVIQSGPPQTLLNHQLVQPPNQPEQNYPLQPQSEQNQLPQQPQNQLPEQAQNQLPEQVQNQPQQPQNQVPPQVPPQNQPQPLWNHVWILSKLFMAVFFLTQGSTWTRTIFLSFIALIVFSIQTGLLRLPNPQIVPDAIQNIQNNPIDPPLQPQPEQPQNQELDPQLQQPRTLFGLISFVAYTFIASIMPDPIANPIPLD